MFSNANQVIVLPEDYDRVSIHSFSAHHRNFPEVHSAGSSSRDAAARLVELLAMTLDNAAGDWRREIIAQAIEDVRAFAEQDSSRSKRILGYRLEVQECTITSHDENRKVESKST